LSIYASYLAKEQGIPGREFLWKQALEICSSKKFEVPALVRLTPYVLNEKTPEFLTALRHAREIASDNPVELSELGRIFYRSGEPAEAEEILRQVTVRHPAFSTGWHYLGMILSSRGDMRAAADAYAKYIEVSPQEES